VHLKINPRFKISSTTTMEVLKLDSYGQFHPYSCQFEPCLNNFTFLHQFLTEFHCRNWGFCSIPPNFTLVFITISNFSGL
jgi:hypothetical protein